MFRIDPKLFIEASLDVAQGNYAAWKERTKALREVIPPETSTDDVVRLTIRGLFALRAQIPGTDIQGLVSEVAPFIAALWDWGRAGYPVFSLTPDFFEAMHMTDFGDPSEEPLHLPFHAFVMSFPKSSHFVNASRFFVYRVPTVTGAGDLSTLEVKWQLRQLSVMTADPCFTRWASHFTRKELTDEASRIDEPLKGDYHRPPTAEELPMLRRARIFLGNVMSYIEGAGPLPAEQRKKSAAPAAVERVAKGPTFDVGRSIRLHPGIRAALAAGAGVNAASGFELDKRFLVRGHWKNQPHGPQRSLRKRLWLEPYWKGPETVEAMERLFKLDAPASQRTP